MDESNGEARYLRVREAPRAASNASEGMVYVCGIYGELESRDDLHRPAQMRTFLYRDQAYLVHVAALK